MQYCAKVLKAKFAECRPLGVFIFLVKFAIYDQKSSQKKLVYRESIA